PALADAATGPRRAGVRGGPERAGGAHRAGEAGDVRGAPAVGAAGRLHRHRPGLGVRQPLTPPPLGPTGLSTPRASRPTASRNTAASAPNHRSPRSTWLPDQRRAAYPTSGRVEPVASNRGSSRSTFR